MKNVLIRINFISNQFGIDFRILFFGLKNFFPYLRDFFYFCSRTKEVMRFLPSLHDKGKESGGSSSEYFIQDLFVAQLLYKLKASRILDVGSRVDGFVSNVASYSNVDICDIRPLKTSFKNIKFIKIDICQPVIKQNLLKKYKYVTCLHALEHFGLGRYGDNLSPDSYKNAVLNLSNLMSNDGLLFLSVPVGKSRVEFNSHRVFDAKSLLEVCIAYNLKLYRFFTIFNTKLVEHNVKDINYRKIIRDNYALGIFIFKKND